MPTLYTSAVIVTDMSVPESEKERSRQIAAIKDAAFKRALAAGLPINDATAHSPRAPDAAAAAE